MELKKLTRHQVIRKVKKRIREFGSPAGLNLSKYDLSNVDLSNMNTDELNLRGVIFGTDWYTPHKLKACLKGARFEKTDLQEANFIHVDLSGISFFASNLEYAKLGVANCTNTSFKRANLKGVNFYGTRLDNTDFTECILEDSDFHSAYIGNVNFSHVKIGKELVFENESKYYKYLEKHNVEKRDSHRILFSRLNVARRTYIILKNIFLSNGQYEEASWAYFKEKMVERKTFSIINAHKYYAKHLLKYNVTEDSLNKLHSIEIPNEIIKKLKSILNKKPKKEKEFLQDIEKAIGQKEAKKYGFDILFYLKYPRKGYKIFSIKWQLFFIQYFVKWIFSLFAELSCGYGEKPLRSIFVAFFTIILFTVLYIISGGIASTQSVMTYLDYFNYSLGAFTTIGFSNFQANTPLAQTLTSLKL
ncbi:MAG: hypothetical protein GF353_04505 [Candidatus Lokiarchaeota archaeon]|nr:hypothetical protein [Candidatus Lokiarchaeota archaeon]